MSDTCQNCKWSKAILGRPDENGVAPLHYMECRRYAPRPVENITDDWPTVKPDDWCGEFDDGSKPF